MRNKSDIAELFDEVQKQYGAMIRRVCLMYASAEVAYDDLVQEAMVNIWTGLASFRGDASLSSWVYRVTVNSCLTWLRANRRHMGHKALDEAIAEVAGDDSERQEQLRLMYKLINTLPPFDRALTIMWLDGLSYDAISEISGITAANVAVRLHRIRKHLQKQAGTIWT